MGLGADSGWILSVENVAGIVHRHEPLRGAEQRNRRGQCIGKACRRKSSLPIFRGCGPREDFLQDSQPLAADSFNQRGTVLPEFNQHAEGVADIFGQTISTWKGR